MLKLCFIFVICIHKFSAVQSLLNVIGIDLGTSYSRVGVYRNGTLEMIPNDQGRNITPSVVAFTESGRILVGDLAKSQQTANPENTIFDVSRLIGRTVSDDEFQTLKNYFPFKIKRNKLETIYIEIDLDGEKRIFYPEEISSLIIKELKSHAEKYLVSEVTDAILSVPAYFNQAQRQATSDAGRMAGLNIITIINAPDAATLTYAWLTKNDHQHKNLLVYDIGGATVDVSILTLENEVYDVVATSGDTNLGGENFNQRVKDHFVKLIFQKTGKDITSDKKTLQQLLREVERAKRFLSSSDVTKVEIDSLDNFSKMFTRKDFENLTMNLFERAMQPVKNVLEDAKMTRYQIHQVLLTGGSTRIPKILQLMKQNFDRVTIMNSDSTVAYGAAIKGGIRSGTVPKSNSTLILKRSLFTIGVRKADGRIEPMISRNEPLPIQYRKIFTTYNNGQNSVKIKIYEGDNAIASTNQFLAEMEAIDVVYSPRGKLDIEVTFYLDIENTLEVTTKELPHGVINKIVINEDQQRPLRRIEDKYNQSNFEWNWPKIIAGIICYVLYSFFLIGYYRHRL